jgi:Reverse transcriptase (RNA-dependent DNA polymerase)
MMMMIHLLPELGQTLPAKPPHRTLSNVVEDIVKDMLPTSRTEGADEVLVNPPMPAPEGEVIDTIDEVWDQALVEDVLEPRPPPAPDPAPTTNIDEQNNELEEPPVGQNLRRSSHLCRPNSRLLGPEWTNVASSGQYEPCCKVRLGVLNDQFLQALDWQSYREEGTSMSFVMKQMMQSLVAHTDPVSDTVEWMLPMVLGVAANDADNPTWAEAVNSPNAQGFCDAMDKEIKTLKQDKDAWDVVKREPWMNVLPSTWAFKVKRLADGIVQKLKARFCVQGDPQVQNVDYFETFCPVVSWTTVCLMLIVSSILDLSTIQADYTAAFLHAPIEEDVYVQMPRNYVRPGMILKLKRCLYGLKQLPRNFFLHLKAQLEVVGFTSNDDVDPCLFVSDKVICLIYVDDTLFFLPKKEYIDQVIQKLKVDRQMDLEIESNVSGSC